MMLQCTQLNCNKYTLVGDVDNWGEGAAHVGGAGSGYMENLYTLCSIYYETKFKKKINSSNFFFN